MTGQKAFIMDINSFQMDQRQLLAYYSVKANFPTKLSIDGTTIINCNKLSKENVEYHRGVKVQEEKCLNKYFFPVL